MQPGPTPGATLAFGEWGAGSLHGGHEPIIRNAFEPRDGRDMSTTANPGAAAADTLYFGVDISMMRGDEAEYAEPMADAGAHLAGVDLHRH